MATKPTVKKLIFIYKISEILGGPKPNLSYNYLTVWLRRILEIAVIYWNTIEFHFSQWLAVHTILILIRLPITNGFARKCRLSDILRMTSAHLNTRTEDALLLLHHKLTLVKKPGKDQLKRFKISEKPTVFKKKYLIFCDSIHKFLIPFEEHGTYF